MKPKGEDLIGKTVLLLDKDNYESIGVIRSRQYSRFDSNTVFYTIEFPSMGKIKGYERHEFKVISDKPLTKGLTKLNDLKDI